MSTAEANARMLREVPAMVDALRGAQDVLDDFLAHLSPEEQADDPDLGDLITSIRAILARIDGAPS